MTEEDSEKQEKMTDRVVISGVVLIVAVHLAIVLPLAFALNIWSDEASTLYTTQNGLFRTFQNVFSDEKQAPFYFLVLSVWREIDSSVFFARLFSIIMSVAAIVTFFRASTRLFRPRSALLLTAFFGLHPYLIWSSLEIRVYSTVIFLSVALLSTFHAGFLDDESERSSRSRVLFVLVAIVAIYTNYFLGFTLAGAFVAVLIVGKWSATRRYFLLMFIVGLAILPLLWMIKLQLAVVSTDVKADSHLGEGLRLIWNSVLTFLLPTEIFPPEDITLISFVRLWFVRFAIVAAAAIFLLRRKIPDANLLAYGTVSAVIILFLLFAYFLIGHIYLEVRHAAVFFAPLVLCLALMIRELFGRLKPASSRLPAVGAAALVLSVFAYSVLSLNWPLAKRGDWKRVAEFVSEHEKPGEAIIVFPAYDVLNLPYYYRGPNRVLPDERMFGWGYEAEFGSAESHRAQSAFVISKIPAEARQIWLLTGDRCHMAMACEPLENFVAANYTIVEDKYFFHQRVRLLRKRLE